MRILVINCGSSSIKADLVDHHDGRRLASARAERIGNTEAATLVVGDDATRLGDDGRDHGAVLARMLPALLERVPADKPLAGVGHRVAHGGERFDHPVRIDDSVEAVIESLAPLAPLHNPVNLAGIRAARRLLPEVPHVAVFDTAFHATLPARARTYALPVEVAERHGIRRYGFHGPSHEYVAHQAAEFLGSDVRDLRIITCHLGNGASITAIEHGRSVETSMGMTPLEGLVMGTRSGDVDPGALIHLMRSEGLDADGLDHLLNERSGLAGLSGVGNDLRDIERRAAEGDERCRQTLHVLTHRVRKYIGAYAAVMGGVDAIVFTAGIGENSALVRHRVAQRLDFLGARLDEDANREARLSHDTPVVAISKAHSRCALLVVATDESLAIARSVSRVVAEQDRVRDDRPIPVAISARHVHLRQETVEKLFGAGHTLTVRNPLSQPGQYACQETVTLVGPKRSIEGVRILGPVRREDQVEISRTDEFWLGIDAPVRASGDIANSPGIKLVGPAGEVELTQGVICAWRHIHMTPDDAEYFGVKDRDVVEVAIRGTGRDLVFGDVLVRVSPDFRLEMHIDTDEGNAAELTSDATGSLVPTGGEAHLRRRRSRYDAPVEA